MSDNKRRKLLKSIAAGSGAVIAGKNLPESWSQPIVDSVILPTHAQTSPGQYTSGGLINLSSIQNDGMYARVLDSLAPSANAQIPSFDAEICISANGDGTAKVEALIVRGCEMALFSANAVIGGASVVMTMDQECTPLIGLMDKMGLIRNANAGDFYDDPVSVQIDALGAMAEGRFIFYGGDLGLPFEVPGGACGSPTCPDVCD